ncbi:MAG: hypothetical protein P8Z37_07010 [Acidobacteriota bacterium]
MPKAFRFTLIFIGLICLYLGWVYVSRWREQQALREIMDEQKGSQESTLSDYYGDGDLKLLNFYTTAPYLPLGETAKLCYGVASAETVRIEPPVEDVWPAISRCVDIAPQKDTIYRLIAEDAEGNTVSAEVSVKIIE